MRKLPLQDFNPQGGASPQDKVLEYEFLNKLGEGSYGTVYKVKRKSDKKICVIKEINMTKLSSRAKNDAKNEVTILSQLDNEYIVKYLESFLENNKLYIVMEYCEGGDLATYMKNQAGKPLAESKVWKFFIQMCLGLEYIHKLKILHRDIKTLNIFLSKEESVRIGDLGVAKVLCDTSNFARTMVGTPYYLSPEMCEEKPYNEKSDVWALGCVLYEICTNRHPFEGNSQGNLMAKIIKGKFNPLPDHYSRELKEIVAVCLNRDYMRRLNVSEILDTEVMRKKADQLSININRAGTGTALPLKSQTKKKSDNELSRSKKADKSIVSPEAAGKPPSNRQENKEQQLKKLIIKNQSKLKQNQDPVQVKPSEDLKYGMISDRKEQPVSEKRLEDFKRVEDRKNEQQPTPKLIENSKKPEAQGIFSKIRQQGFSVDISKASPGPFAQKKGPEVKPSSRVTSAVKREEPTPSKNPEDRRDSIFRPVSNNNPNIFKNIASEVLKNPFGKKPDVPKLESKKSIAKEEPAKVAAKEEAGKANAGYKEPFMRDFKSVHRIRKGAPLELAWQAVMVGKVAKESKPQASALPLSQNGGGKAAAPLRDEGGPSKKNVQNKVTTYKNQAEYMNDLLEVQNLPDIKKDKARRELNQEEQAYIEKNEWKFDFFKANNVPLREQTSESTKNIPDYEEPEILQDAGESNQSPQFTSGRTVKEDASFHDGFNQSEEAQTFSKFQKSEPAGHNVSSYQSVNEDNDDKEEQGEEDREEDKEEQWEEDSEGILKGQEEGFLYAEEENSKDNDDQEVVDEQEEEEVFVSDDDLNAEGENTLTKEDLSEKLQVYEIREKELGELIEGKVGACVSEIGSDAFDYIITFFKSKLNSANELNEQDQLEIDRMIEERLEDQNNPSV